jgi:hypothetical protein
MDIKVREIVAELEIPQLKSVSPIVHDIEA